MPNYDFPGAALDDWKTQSDLDGERTARRCPACEFGQHDKCWNSSTYDRCLCYMRDHKGAAS